jgi:hypothetical protein
MAERFGGKYSPDGQKPAALKEAAVDERRVDAAGARANILFVPGVVLVFLSLGGGPQMLVTGLVAGGVLTLAAWLLREGLRAEAAYDARKVARKPALPRKMLATVLTGLGVAGAALTGDSGIAGSLLYGIAAAGLHVAAFGIDPLRDKLVEGIDQFQQDRVARVVDEAETYLSAIGGHIAALKDRKLDIRIAAFQATARKMIRTVEEDPRDLTGARKFLVVYLMGARDAAAKFADLYRRTRDAGARADFEALLSDLETSFAGTTQKMLQDGRSDLDIEIKVLRDRLQREGIKPE